MMMITGIYLEGFYGFKLPKLVLTINHLNCRKIRPNSTQTPELQPPNCFLALMIIVIIIIITLRLTYRPTHSFIQTIYIAPLQVHFYSEALPTQHGYCAGVSRRSATHRQL